MALFWDASGLAKRYIAEQGSDVADALFEHVALRDMISTPWGYTETYAILLRRRNNSQISETAFTDALTALQEEVVNNPDFVLLSLTDDVVFSSTAIIHKHNLNATDAAILALLLDALPNPPPGDFLLVAADKRLLRAAESEGFRTLNPEEVSIADIPALLASL